MNFNQITFIHFLLVFISIIYAFEVTGKNNFDIKLNGLPQMATFNNYEDIDKYIESSRKMDTIENPTMDTYLTAYNLYHIESNKHNINKRSANPYDFIKFELADAKIPDAETKKLLQINHEREQKKLKDEDANGPPIIRGSRMKTKTNINNNSSIIKIKKRSDDQMNTSIVGSNADDINNNEDQEISESRRTLNFYQPRLNSGIKTKKSIKSFPHEVQKAINLILNDNKLNNNFIGVGGGGGGVGINSNIGLRYAPTHKQFYGDKILTNNYDGNYHHKLHQQINNDKFKYIYTPSQILYNNHYNYNSDGISQYGGIPYTNLQTEIDNSEKQIISKTPSVIIGNGIAPAPSATSSSSSHDSHLSEISDVHTLIQPQTLVKIEPEINYVIQEVQPPSQLSHSSSSDQLAAKPSISYKHYLSAPNILHNNKLLSKSVFIPTEYQFNDVKNKGYFLENNHNNNNNAYGDGGSGDDDGGKVEHNQFEQISYESLGDYEKQIIKEHNLFNGVNEQHQLTGKENNNNNNNEKDDSYRESGGEKYNILSSLIGKSPSEQLNGLTYLLENELLNNNNHKNDEEQQKQQQQQQVIIPKRPQDNRSPILFHPDNKIGAGVVGQGKNIIINKYGFKEVTNNNNDDNVQKDYKPITEAPEEIHSHHVVHITPSPLPAPVSTSFKHVHSIGLSPNYKDIDFQPKQFGMKLDDKGLQYASKYAFGYRVRDFHTGNDFGHKQNRDHDGVTRGEYHILLPDGRVQNVRYHADDSGFHADVSFETGH